ncbi:hypothetical protein DH2020_039823 [Rehmannia glutinosa]|uniref:Transcription repressor n=1 Tax=Rehmannia glutinosa TaxID=99300 RepID=A0ABR0UWY0_REHGL
MKFPFLFKSPETTTTSAAASWPWPSCATSPKTLSFRATTTPNDIIHNTEFDSFGHYNHHKEIFSYKSETPNNVESAIVGGLKSKRLFFEPGETKSILEEAKTPESEKSTRTEEGVAIVEIDSRDPFLDFRVSMEEMVAAAHDGIKDNWGFLEELLACYLRFNCKSNHGYIVGAFLDLVIRLSLGSDFSDISSCFAADAAAANDESCFSSSSTATDQYSFTSPLSFSSSTDSSASRYCLSSWKILKMRF